MYDFGKLKPILDFIQDLLQRIEMSRVHELKVQASEPKLQTENVQ